MRFRAGLGARCGVCIVSVVVFSGCATLRPATPAPVSGELPSPTELEAVLRQRYEALQGLRGLAHLRYSDPTESSSSRQAIVVQRPDHVRIEVLSLFGTAFLLVADGSLITAYVPDERTVYRGPATPENLWRYTRLWLPVKKLVDIVLATPTASADAASSVAFDAAAAAVSLRSQTPDGTQSVWFTAGRQLVAAEERDSHGGVRWLAHYSKYEERNGLSVPTHIVLELPRWSRSMELDLQDVDVNPAIDGAMFALQPPPGSKVVELQSEVD
ncbi:MAG: DUF4292 domain-containing protein [Deltaproteobacteria bacterium]|nr:DUF4292 domain-containing protein [Deltaproteobacteria bacterium]